MPEDKGLFDRLKERGDELLTQVSADLMQNPTFMKAMESALRGKQKIDEGAAQALKSMNIPTRSEFKRALTRIEALEQELQAVKAKVKKAPASTARKAAPKKR
jgi:polyhydroxyalkanoate synthesis regulator phasin